MFLLATWRNARPPVRVSDPVHIVLPRHGVILSPFKGQPKKYAQPRRLPGLEVRKSGIPKAGNGLWLAENVRAGQSIALFRRKRISEAASKKLHKKVHNHDFFSMPLNFAVDNMICSEIGTSASTVQLACVWTRSR